MKIRNGFIRSFRGDYYNLKDIHLLSVHADSSDNSDYWISAYDNNLEKRQISRYNSKKEAQKALDEIMEKENEAERK
jgi:hypothetical protein